MKNKQSFTLIELLVVIAIIGLLSTVVLVSLNGVRARARDARRLSDMKTIQTALEAYYNDKGYYPPNNDNDCAGWDTGFNGNSSDPFISELVSGGYLSAAIGDPLTTGSCQGYLYYRYLSGEGGCTNSFYVLGVVDMENSGNPHPTSPGWSCPTRNWQSGMEWVTGSFE